jgi:hypothetical protein
MRHFYFYFLEKRGRVGSINIFRKLHWLNRSPRVDKLIDYLSRINSLNPFYPSTIVHNQIFFCRARFKSLENDLEEHSPATQASFQRRALSMLTSWIFGQALNMSRSFSLMGEAGYAKRILCPTNWARAISSEELYWMPAYPVRRY